jgi:RNA polymerase sigma-70 factor (ECF subfamily)
MGDRTAFREIVRRHKDHVFRVALRLTRDEALAQDATQDAFLQVFRKIDQFEANAAFSTWLHRVAANAALMRMRALKRRHEAPLVQASPSFTAPGDLADPPDEDSPAIDDGVSTRELALHAARAVEALPDVYRSIFVSRELEDLSTEEVAERFHITASAVKTRLYRARVALRRSLSRLNLERPRATLAAP